MNIRDLVKLTGSFFHEVVQETSSLYDIVSELSDDIYEHIFQIIDENSIDNIQNTETVKYDILRLKFKYEDGVYSPDDTDVATFYWDGTMVWGDPDYVYGIGGAYPNSSDPNTTADYDEYAFHVDKSLSGAKLQDRFINPTVELIEGTDFYLGPDSIVIKQDSVNNSAFTTRVFRDENNLITGKEITLYVTNRTQDTEKLYNRYGYLVDIDTDNKSLIKEVYRLFLLGPRVAYIHAAFNLILGLPVILDEDGETITSISSDSKNYTIITDKNTYIFDVNAKLKSNVSVGKTYDHLLPLCENIVLYDTGEWWTRFNFLDVNGKITNGDPILIENKTVGLVNISNPTESFKFGDYLDLDTFKDGRDLLKIQFGMKTSYGEVVKFGMKRKDITINVFDTFFGMIWRNSLYYFKVYTSGVSKEALINLNKVFHEIMPMHTQPLYYIVAEIDEDAPCATIEDTPKPDQCLSDICVSAANHTVYVCPNGGDGINSSPWNTDVRSDTVEVMEGYYGQMRIGGFLLGGAGMALGAKCWSEVPLFIYN